MKRLLPGILLLLCALAASAQTTQITASHISLFGGATVTGQFCVSPVDQSGNPINIQVPAGQQLASTSQLCFPITSGVLSNTAVVPDTSLTQPVNACYNLKIYNNLNQQLANYPCIQPQGATWSFDAYVPSSTSTIPSLSLPQFQTNGVTNAVQGILNLVGSGVNYSSGGTVTIAGGGGESSGPGTVTTAMLSGVDLFQAMNTLAATLPGGMLDTTQLACGTYTVTHQLTALNLTGKKFVWQKLGCQKIIDNTVFSSSTTADPAYCGIPIGGDGAGGNAIVEVGNNTSNTGDIQAGPSFVGYDLMCNGKWDGSQESAIISGVNLQGNSSATIGGSLMHVSHLFSGTIIEKSSTYLCYANCLTVNNSGNVLFQGNQWEDGATTGSYPGAVVNIDSVSSSLGNGPLLFEGDSIQHQGPHNPLIVVNGHGGLQSGAIQFYDSYFEFSAATASTANPDVTPIQVIDSFEVGFHNARIQGLTNNGSTTDQQYAIEITGTGSTRQSFDIEVDEMSTLGSMGFTCLVKNTIDGSCHPGFTNGLTGSAQILALPNYLYGQIIPTDTLTNIAAPGGWCNTYTLGSTWTNSTASTNAKLFCKLVSGTPTAVALDNAASAVATVHQTGQTAAISPATLCSGATCPAGEYEINVALMETGTACSSATAGSVTPSITWMDTNGTAHTSTIPQLLAGMPFATSLSNAVASGTLNISTNGTAIQYSTAYTACTTGTGTYQLDIAIGSAAGSGGGGGTAGGLVAANNLSDLPSASTARTNLGLGTAATSATSAFDAAGAGTTAAAAALVCAKTINGISYSACYTGSTLDVRLNAANSDAINHTNGNTTSLIDATGESGSQTVAAQINIGNSSGAPVGLILPCTGHWSGTMTDGTSAVMNVYGGASVTSDCPASGPAGLMTMSPSSSSNLGYVFRTTTSSAPYLYLRGFNVVNIGGGHVTANNVGFYLNGPLNDGTTIDNVNVYDSLDTYSAEAYNVSSGITWQNSSFSAGNYGTAFLAKTDNSGYVTALSLHNDTLVHPGPGQYAFLCQDTATPSFPRISSVTLDKTYTESGTDNTTAVYKVDGCGKVSFAHTTIKSYGTYPPGNDGAAGVLITNAYNSDVQIDDMRFQYGTSTWAYPATAVINNYNGDQAQTDSIGNFGHYTPSGVPNYLGTLSTGSLNNYSGITSFSAPAATSGANFGSPPIKIGGNYWNGSASTSSYLQNQLVYGTGANPTETYQFTMGGTPSSGVNKYAFDQAVWAPSLVATGLTPGNCVQASTGGLLTTTGAACGTSGSGITGLTSGYIPLAGSATTLTANSHVDDGVTTAATVTSTEPIVAPSITTSGAGAGQYKAFNSAGTFYNIFSSVATANNTFYPFASTPVNGDMVSASSSGSTETLTDSGVLASAVVTSLTTTGSGAATLSGHVLNVPTPAGGSLPTSTGGQTYYSSGTTGAATSAVLVSSAATTGVMQFGGAESHFGTGPTSATTTNGSTTNVATTLTVVSTTGYPSCSTQTPCFLVLGSNNFAGEIVSCTAIGSSTTFTGCSRNLFGSTAANPLATGSSVDLAAHLYADSSTSTFYHYLSIWNGPDFYNGTGNITIGATLQGSNAGSYFIGGSNQTTNFALLGWGVGNGALRAGDGGTKFQNGATAVIGELDQDGILAQLAGTLPVTAGTTSITPVTGVVVLTGTVPTSGTLLSMAVPSGACTVANQSCHLTIINTTTASLTTGSGTAAGNFALAYTLPLKGEMICNAYGATALWYCTR